MTLLKALDDNYAPYAPTKSVVQVIMRYRERGLPEPLTADALKQIGVSDTMTSPVFRTLRFLELVDDEGVKTNKFEIIRRASTDEYPSALASVLRDAYGEVFSIIDPAKDDEQAVADAFRKYDPATQRPRMTRLFFGLCEEAGLREPQRKRRSRSTAPAVKSRATRTTPSTDDAPVAPMIEPGTELDYRLISAIVQQLPRNGKWSSVKRQKWIDAMTSAVDLLCDVDNDDEDADIELEMETKQPPA